MGTTLDALTSDLVLDLCAGSRGLEGSFIMILYFLDLGGVENLTKVSTTSLFETSTSFSLGFFFSDDF